MSCLSYIIAGIVGASVAFIELGSRFSEDPKWVLKNFASWVYLLINAFVSVLVYTTVMAANISIGGIPISNNEYMAAGIIGLVSMGILRSSVLNIKYGGKDSDIGLHKTIDVLLNWIEQLYDRNKSTRLIKEVAPLVADISYQSMHKAIVPTCMSALTKLTPSDNHDIISDGNKLANELTMPEQAKTCQLAIRTVKVTGIDLFKESVNVYKEKVLEDTSPTAKTYLKIAEIQRKLLDSSSAREQ